ncbi:MAG TPA: hypothetical protein VF162_14965 [Streptosporangiaceae bacterium]
MNDKTSIVELDEQDLLIITAGSNAKPGDFPVSKSDFPVSK